MSARKSLPYRNGSVTRAATPKAAAVPRIHAALQQRSNSAFSVPIAVHAPNKPVRPRNVSMASVRSPACSSCQWIPYVRVYLDPRGYPILTPEVMQDDTQIGYWSTKLDEIIFKNFQFFEAQKSGSKDFIKTPWRGDSFLGDNYSNRNVFRDLKGGFFDAGGTWVFGILYSAGMSAMCPATSRSQVLSSRTK